MTNYGELHSTIEKLLSVLRNPQEKKLLQVELAVTVDAGMPFVKATYNLEGDGTLALTCYDTISTLNISARQAHYPNFGCYCCTYFSR